VVTYAKQQVAYFEKGTEGALPTSGPIPIKGTDVWVISCGQAAIGCSLPTSAMMTAGRMIGWKMHLYDGQLNPALWGRGIQDAIAAGAKGIITYGIDCPLVKQALIDAKQAKVPVFDDEGFDCSYPGAGGGQSLFGATMQYTPKYPTLQAFRGAAGTAQADWLIANAGPDAKILEFKDTQILTNLAVNQGFEKEISAHCPDCTVYPIDLPWGTCRTASSR
jgi:ribose transport system substrate-binding protein